MWVIDKEVAWNGLNTLRVVIREAVARGVPEETIVLLLMLPLVASLVSFLHYVVGISGYGTFMPTMIAVAFVSTGVAGGLVLFALILLITVVGGRFLKKLKLHYWPARSINLLIVAMGVFFLMVISSFIQIIDISKLSIYPILFMIVLAEEFVKTQMAKSKREAKVLALGTIFVALVGAGLMGLLGLQFLVMRYPEVMILLAVGVNLWVGNYTGLRFTELARFKKAIRE